MTQLTYCTVLYSIVINLQPLLEGKLTYFDIKITVTILFKLLQVTTFAGSLFHKIVVEGKESR